MSTPPYSLFYLLKCAHCEGHFKISGETPSSFFVSCPSCGGGLGSSGALQPEIINTTLPASASAPPANPAKAPASRIVGILPRDAGPSASRGFQSPEFGGATFAAPASRAPVSTSPEFQGKNTPPAKDTFIPDKHDAIGLNPRRLTNTTPADGEYVKPDGWEIEKSDEQPITVADPKTPRAVFFALTGLVLALCIWVAFKLISTSDELAEQNAAENRARREAIEAQAPKDPEAAARQARQLAGEAAYNFLHAQNLKALKKYIREPEVVGKLLDRLHPDPTTFEQFAYERIVPDEDITVSESGKFFTVDVVQTDKTRKPLILEQVARRTFLADWQSYVGYSEIPWTDLLVDRPSDPVILRARVTPGDYFANAFNNSKIYACFTLRDDLRQVTIYGYAPLRSSITTDTLAFTEEEIANGTEKLVMLSVSYPPKTRNTNQVNIEEFLHNSWFRE